MKKLTVALTLALMVSSAIAQDIFVKKSLFSQFEPAIEKNQIINDGHTIGDYPLLPIGEKTRVVFIKVNYSTGVSIPLGRVVMFSEKNKKLLHAIETTANLEQGPSNDWVDTPCKREDYLWKSSVGGVFKDINCVSINHFVNYFVNPTGEFQQIAALAKFEDLQIPPTIIRVTFTRYSGGGKRLVYIVDINPEQYGVQRDATTPWGSNGWHKDFVTRDSKKIWFLENLKIWALDVQSRMDRAFEKDKSAFLDIRPLSSYFVEPMRGHNEAKPTVSIEDEVIALKRLLDRGLISEGQFNEQVKNLIQKN